ncbi:MAG TPA: zf-HC2 domain-containing protein, partial [Ktedonobacteraceae bacterium]|nr:zf-HC2 domain-containing protein [Ktedonobacteraceae bacterium]
MNCELVEERLSAYLDSVLASDESRKVSIHLQACSRCMKLLAELRQNDLLVARLPRITPHPALRERLFALPELQELTGTGNDRLSLADEWTRPLGPRQLSGRSSNLRPRLVSLPGGRNYPIEEEQIPATPPTVILHPSSPNSTRRTEIRHVSVLRIVVAAALVLLLGTAGLIALKISQTTPRTANKSGVISPPAAGPSSGPLAAGTRFVFLRDGTLWSTLVDGSNSHSSERLTPENVTVAPGWLVSPSQTGHTAGNMLAYLDLRGATIHTIRSDGQQDTILPQALLARGTSPASVWNTATGASILNSLAWSVDGHLLAFVADPSGKGITNLYLYSFETGKVQQIPLTLKGSVLRPVWSPDSLRLAFEVVHDGQISVLDYNVQNQGVLDLSNLDASAGGGASHILSLNWSPSASTPAVTWSLGTTGHINSLWIHYIGANGTLYPQLLSNGSYTQAIYNARGAKGMGSWLVIAEINGQAGDISHIDLVPGAQLATLSREKQVSFACWSPDGSTIFYIEAQSKGVGNGSFVNLVTEATYPAPKDIAVSPAP